MFCARPSQSETIQLRSHKGMGKMTSYLRQFSIHGVIREYFSSAPYQCNAHDNVQIISPKTGGNGHITSNHRRTWDLSAVRDEPWLCDDVHICRSTSARQVQSSIEKIWPDDVILSVFILNIKKLPTIDRTSSKKTNRWTKACKVFERVASSMQWELEEKKSKLANKEDHFRTTSVCTTITTFWTLPPAPLPVWIRVERKFRRQCGWEVHFGWFSAGQLSLMSN